MAAKYDEAPKAPRNNIVPTTPLPAEWQQFFNQLIREINDLRSRLDALE